jgi:hypothetical protein
VVTGPYPPALNRQTSSTVTAWIYGVFALALVVLFVFMVRGYIRNASRNTSRGAKQDNAPRDGEAD